MSSVKKTIPDFIKLPYHFARSHTAAIAHGYPAKKMLIIGITGTKGKTSTANFVWSVLRAGGYKTGLISTAIFRYDSVEELNPYDDARSVHYPKKPPQNGDTWNGSSCH